MILLALQYVLSLLAHTFSWIVLLAVAVLLVRDDLCAAVIALVLQRTDQSRRLPIVVSVDWKNEMESIVRPEVPAVVWLQTMVNRVMRYEGEQLKEIDELLSAVAKRLSDVQKHTHLARTAYRYEKMHLDVLAKQLEEDLQKKTTGTNTDESEEKNAENGVSSTRPFLIGENFPNIMVGSAVEFVEMFKKRLIAAVLWSKNAATFMKYWKTAAVKTCRLLNASLRSEYAIRFVQFVVDTAGRIVNLAAEIYLDYGTTRVSIEVFPQMPSII